MRELKVEYLNGEFGGEGKIYIAEIPKSGSVDDADWTYLGEVKSFKMVHDDELQIKFPPIVYFINGVKYSE